VAGVRHDREARHGTQVEEIVQLERSCVKVRRWRVSDVTADPGDLVVQKLRNLITEKANRFPTGSPDRYRLLETLELSDDALLDELFSHVDPNPDRVGCPPDAILIELAQRTRPFSDRWWEHIMKCAPVASTCGRSGVSSAWQSLGPDRHGTIDGGQRRPVLSVRSAFGSGLPDTRHQRRWWRRVTFASTPSRDPTLSRRLLRS
jgi:hypothetical protein